MDEQQISRLVRFQVLTAASMMFRIVFWDVLPCKMIVDRRFRTSRLVFARNVFRIQAGLPTTMKSVLFFSGPPNYHQY
jgi:hypothetical protein